MPDPVTITMTVYAQGAAQFSFGFAEALRGFLPIALGILVVGAFLRMMDWRR